MIRSLQPPDRVQLVLAREIEEAETNGWYLHNVRSVHQACLQSAQCSRVRRRIRDIARVLVEGVLQSTLQYITRNATKFTHSKSITNAEELEVDRNARNSALSDSLVLRKEISEPMVSARARGGICAGLTQRRWGRSVRRTWATRPLSHMLYSLPQDTLTIQSRAQSHSSDTLKTASRRRISGGSSIRLTQPPGTCLQLSNHERNRHRRAGQCRACRRR